ncbi:hypothetical protein ACFQ0B_57750 [Nonomuraea thailandensis]
MGDDVVHVAGDALALGELVGAHLGDGGAGGLLGDQLLGGRGLLRTPR